MIRTTLSIGLLTGIVTTGTLKAEPSPTPSSKKQTATTSKTTSTKTSKVAPAPVTKEGWSFVNGTWIHSDGYKFVNGQVIRVGTQTHKKPPKPPTKAEMDAAMKKGPQTPADAAAKKAAERERNLAPSRPASQTGTHL
jgi:hypothetical protein